MKFCFFLFLAVIMLIASVHSGREDSFLDEIIEIVLAVVCLDIAIGSVL